MPLSDETIWGYPDAVKKAEEKSVTTDDRCPYRRMRCIFWDKDKCNARFCAYDAAFDENY